MRRAVPGLVALVAAVAAGQEVDILRTAPPTSIYIETIGRDCDGYLSADQYLASVEASPANWRDCQVDVRIRGIINREGARRFADVTETMARTGTVPRAIVLDSRGGDADAAISIARRIRTDDLFRRSPVTTRISIGYDAVCFSACVVIFSAGYSRELEFDINGDSRLPSRIGIHGPGQFDRRAGRYDTSAGNAEIERVKRRLKDYFGDVGVEPGLVDDMFSVPFDEIRLLDRQELVAYGLYP